MTLTQQGFIFPDEADAIAYWRGREIRTWAVDVQAGPTRRPSYRQTVYVRARGHVRRRGRAARDLPGAAALGAMALSPGGTA